MRSMDATEIAEVARQAGFRGHDLRVAVAVALAESGGRPGVNAAGAEDSRGLWQINSVHFGGLNEDRLYEPLYNAKAAHDVWQESKGFRSDPWDAWSTYQNGLHRPFLDDAARGIARLHDAGGSGGPGGPNQPSHQPSHQPSNQHGEHHRHRESRGEHAGLRPWSLPHHPFQGRKVRVDGALLRDLAERLTDLLATVDQVYRRCRRERDDLGALNLADNSAEKRLKNKLDEALDEWNGLRRLPYLMAKDIGYVVDVKRRFAEADRGAGRATIETLIASLHGGYGRGTRKDVAALLRALYGRDTASRVRRFLPTSPRRHGNADRGGGGGHAPAAPERIDLRELATIARSRFDLTIREFEPFDDVDPVHTSTSWHYKNRAFDASGSTQEMSRFADWVADHYRTQLKELFWNGPNPRNVKNGEPVGQWFVPGHTDHVHVAM
jgi:Lysozyme like domain